MGSGTIAGTTIHTPKMVADEGEAITSELWDT